MYDVDLTTPLLQLNPPVLVRADGGTPTVADLVALRRSGGGTTTVAATHNSTTITTAHATTPAVSSSLAARKLHDAKSVARQISRSGEVPPRAHTTDIPGRRRGTQKGNGLHDAATTRAADHAAYAATGSAPPSPSAAARGGHSFGSAADAAHSETDEAGAAVLVASAAAPSSAGNESIALSLPHLMRHIGDTGALLDTLFPLQPLHNAASSPTRAETVSVQTVSAAPASREDVMALHATLRERLEARRARASGLCGIRRSIYIDLFSELVRQVTIEEPARGLLLARVRENEEHALQVHAGLLREGENFVASKLLQDTQSMAVLQERLSDLRKDKTQLEVRRHDLQDARQELERRFEEQRQTRRAQQQDELNYLRRANQQLSLRLKMETERASSGGGGAAAAGGGAEESNAAGAAPSAAS